MAQKLFTVEDALNDIEHHISPHKARLMFAAGATKEEFEYRFKIVKDAVVAVRKQIHEVREAALKSQCRAVIELLDKKSIPSGHDFEALVRRG